MLIASVLFYLPRFLWKSLEDGRLQTICDEKNLLLGEAENVPMQDIITNRILKFFKQNRKSNQAYAVRFFFCEMMNLMTVILVWTMTDLLMGQSFLVLGFQYLVYLKDWIFGSSLTSNPMDSVFPKIAKCTFHKYSYSSQVPQSVDGICVLPLNTTMEKMYFFLWFWYLSLGLVGCVMAFTRIGVMVCTPTKRC